MSCAVDELGLRLQDNGVNTRFARDDNVQCSQIAIELC